MSRNDDLRCSPRHGNTRILTKTLPSSLGRGSGRGTLFRFIILGNAYPTCVNFAFRTDTRSDGGRLGLRVSRLFTARDGAARDLRRRGPQDRDRIESEKLASRTGVGSESRRGHRSGPSVSVTSFGCKHLTKLLVTPAAPAPRGARAAGNVTRTPCTFYLGRARTNVRC
ncbi:hypothetical protein EVAR_37542_1 [Eumeta japonica]|uniref:Uncharacterized protein n=1 Tax=Eumeta variegata TaxID=151549 RepID=A0A4C1XSD8_EUMVA|nr:hypothetical protein EVAR_37542_1 [Eumeta japonica]